MSTTVESRKDEVSLEFLDSFAAAFNRHDVDAILEHMTDDVRFDVSVGPDQWGKRHEGKAAVRQGVLDVFAAVPDGQWEEASHFVAGGRGVSEWVFRGTAPDGRKIEVNGCDVFTFRDGKICVKDSYRKGKAFY